MNEDAKILGITPELYSYGTVRQNEILKAIEDHGGLRPAARHLGIDHSVAYKALKVVKNKAAIQGYSPQHSWTHAVPETHVAKGVSTYFQKTDSTPAAWVKADLRQQAYNDAIRGAIAAFIEDVPEMPAPPGPRDYSTDVIPWINIGDAHLGLLAHQNEIGESFDLKIAERELCGAISQIIEEMPACERCVINDCGDFTHYENFAGETSASQNRLDCDTRFPRMIKVYSRVMRFIVDKVLEKAKHVDIIVNQGNHSRVNDIWMAELLRVSYGHTNRVHVLDNDSVFIGYRMGKTLVMTHHSDKCKPNQLVHVMANDFAKDWGETEFRYIDIGHVHHGMVMKEHPGVFVESFNHLAALDRWAHDGGYRNRKSITVVLRSRTYGEIGRRVLPIQEIRDRLERVKGEYRVPAKQAYTV